MNHLGDENVHMNHHMNHLGDEMVKLILRYVGVSALAQATNHHYLQLAQAVDRARCEESRFSIIQSSNCKEMKLPPTVLFNKMSESMRWVELYSPRDQRLPLGTLGHLIRTLYQSSKIMILITSMGYRILVAFSTRILLHPVYSYRLGVWYVPEHILNVEPTTRHFICNFPTGLCCYLTPPCVGTHHFVSPCEFCTRKVSPECNVCDGQTQILDSSLHTISDVFHTYPQWIGRQPALSLVSDTQVLLGKIGFLLVGSISKKAPLLSLHSPSHTHHSLTIPLTTVSRPSRPCNFLRILPSSLLDQIFQFNGSETLLFKTVSQSFRLQVQATEFRLCKRAYLKIQRFKPKPRRDNAIPNSLFHDISCALRYLEDHAALQVKKNTSFLHVEGRDPNVIMAIVISARKWRVFFTVSEVKERIFQDTAILRPGLWYQNAKNVDPKDAFLSFISSGLEPFKLYPDPSLHSKEICAFCLPTDATDVQFCSICLGVGFILESTFYTLEQITQHAFKQHVRSDLTPQQNDLIVKSQKYLGVND